MVTAKKLKKIADWNSRRLTKKAYKRHIKSTLRQLKESAKYGYTFAYLESRNDEKLIELLQKRGFECKVVRNHLNNVPMLKVKWE